MNKNELEENWWQNTFAKALKGVKKGVVFKNEDTSDEEEEESSQEPEEETSGSEYSEEDEELFKKVSKKYWKKGR